MNGTKTRHTAHVVPRGEDEEHTTDTCVCDPISTVLYGVTVIWHRELRELGL